jgi:Excalibur calcium-binding domain
MKGSAALVVVFALLLAASAGAATAGATPDRPSVVTSVELVPRLWRNCTAVHRRYPHGVGRRGARDKTSGTPVTNFTRSTLLYRRAMRYNSGLDRDKDEIACEKR